MVGTEVVFTELDVLSSRPSARPFLQKELRLRFAGGTFEGKTVSGCCQPYFEVGEDYLVCTLLDGQTYLSPFAGGTQGLFRILQDNQGKLFPVTYNGLGIIASDGIDYKTSQIVNQMIDGKPVYYQTPEFASPDTPPTPDDGIGFARTRRIALPDSMMDLNEFTETIDEARNMQTPQLVTSIRGTLEPLSPVRQPKKRTKLSGTSRTYDANRGTICACGEQPIHLVMQQVPTTWTSYDFNNWSMSNYNDIVDLFRISATDGSWAYNDVDEFCGWPTPDEILTHYSTFTGWGTAIAVCWTSALLDDPCGEIYEADIMFNSAYSWGYDLDDTIGTDTILYRPVVRHELGHAVGLERGSCGAESYKYWQPTTMTAFYSNIVENGKGMHELDAKILRINYESSTSIPAHEDVGVESYYGDNGMVNATMNNSWFMDGDTLELYNVTVENVSKNAQSNIKLRVMLSSNNNISESDRRIKTYTFSNIAAGDYWTGDLSMTIPQTVSTGDYYVGLIATLDGTDYWWDDYSGNNATWMPTPIHVENDGVWTFNDVIALAAPMNPDWLSGAWWVDNTGASDDEGNSGGGICGGPYNRDLWWFFDPEFDGTIDVGIPDPLEVGDSQGFAGQGVDFVEIYQGYPDIGSQPIASSCNTAFEGPAVATVTKGTRYYIRIGGINSGRVTGWAKLNMQPQGLVGDTPALAIPINEGETFDQIPPNSTMFFDVDGGPCVAGGVSGKIDRWFIGMGTHSGTMTATTCGSGNIDTVLGVFTQNLSVIACNDNSATPCIGGETGTSTVHWDVSPGVPFLIQVTLPQDQQQGGLQLTLSIDTGVPTNDSCQTPNSIDGAGAPFTTRSAATSGTYDCLGNPIGCDVWFKWVAPETGVASIGTCEDVGGNTNFDSIVNVYDGCAIENLLACNTSACSDGSSIATLQVIAGNSYFIQVGSLKNDLGGCVSGDGVLGIMIDTSCLGDLDGNGSVNVADILTLIADWGSTSSPADFDENGVVAIGDLLILIGQFGTCP